MTINRSYLGQEPQSLVLNLMYKYLYKPKYICKNIVFIHLYHHSCNAAVLSNIYSLIQISNLKEVLVTRSFVVHSHYTVIKL